MMLIHGTDGMEVMVHYKGQRGEGIYPVAFEGLIKNSGTPLPGDWFRHDESRNTRSFMRITPCRACHGQRLKASLSGSDHLQIRIYHDMTNQSVRDLHAFLDR